MQFITSAQIERFRSIDSLNLPTIGDFAVLAGLNNSGKSNVLRALHLFFTDDVEPHQPLDFARDFYRPDLASKKRKRISVEVSFNLPASFKFRQGLEPSRALLGTTFILRKEWGPDSEPEYFLNGSNVPLSLEDNKKVENFLRLVSVRYIPNRVIPTDLIAREHQALRDVLVRRLSRHNSQSSSLFDAIKRTSSELLSDLSGQMKAASPDLESVSLSTAQGLADLAFKFGYQLVEGGAQTSEHEQGSGIQSLLMLRTLSLIDQDYFKQFGWKQASLWLVEEPESSLHTALEAQVSFFLKELCTRKKGRLQALATTHSDLLIQYSTNSYLIQKGKKPDGKSGTIATSMGQRELLHASAKFGISRWVDPILYNPLARIVLVEGKFDRDFILESNKAAGLAAEYQVFTLEDLLQNPSKGGIDTLIQYVKDRASAIKIRPADAGVILLADWDASNKGASLSNIFKPSDPFRFLHWDAKEANPDLDQTFRGIERFMSTTLIESASSMAADCVATKRNGMRMVSPADFDRLKKAANTLVCSGIEQADARFALPTLKRLLA